MSPGSIRRKGNRSSVHEGHYSFQQVVAAVSAVTGLEREEIRQPKRSERVQRSREMLCYIARRYRTPELARFLQVKELSPASHSMRRAEKRLQEDSGFRRQADQALKRLDSSIPCKPNPIYAPKPDPFMSPGTQVES